MCAGLDECLSFHFGFKSGEKWVCSFRLLNYHVCTMGVKVEGTSHHPFTETVVKACLFTHFRKDIESDTSVSQVVSKCSQTFTCLTPNVPLSVKTLTMKPLPEGGQWARPLSQCQLLKNKGAGEWERKECSTALVLTRFIQAKVSTKLKGLHSGTYLLINILEEQRRQTETKSQREREESKGKGGQAACVGNKGLRKKQFILKAQGKQHRSKEVTEENRHSPDCLSAFRPQLHCLGLWSPQSAQANQGQNLSVPAGKAARQISGAQKLGLRFTTGRHTSSGVSVSPSLTQ